MSQTGDNDKEKSDVVILLSSFDHEPYDNDAKDVLVEVLLSQYETSEQEHREDINLADTTDDYIMEANQQKALS